MTFAFQPLSQGNALVIADQWKYDGAYSFYDMTADLEDYEEFIDEGLRNANDHYQAMADGGLAGFFCVVRDGPALEIGLGLRPDLCGKGAIASVEQNRRRYQWFPILKPSSTNTPTCWWRWA